MQTLFDSDLLFSRPDTKLSVVPRPSANIIPATSFEAAYQLLQRPNEVPLICVTPLPPTFPVFFPRFSTRRRVFRRAFPVRADAIVRPRSCTPFTTLYYTYTPVEGRRLDFPRLCITLKPRWRNCREETGLSVQLLVPKTRMKMRFRWLAPGE